MIWATSFYIVITTLKNKQQKKTNNKTKQKIVIFAYCMCEAILKHNAEYVREMVKQYSVWIDRKSIVN